MQHNWPWTAHIGTVCGSTQTCSFFGSEYHGATTSWLNLQMWSPRHGWTGYIPMAGHGLDELGMYRWLTVYWMNWVHTDGWLWIDELGTDRGWLTVDWWIGYIQTPDWGLDELGTYRQLTGLMNLVHTDSWLSVDGWTGYVQMADCGLMNWVHIDGWLWIDELGIYRRLTVDCWTGFIQTADWIVELGT